MDRDKPESKTDSFLDRFSGLFVAQTALALITAAILVAAWGFFAWFGLGSILKKELGSTEANTKPAVSKPEPKSKPFISKSEPTTKPVPPKPNLYEKVESKLLLELQKIDLPPQSDSLITLAKTIRAERTKYLTRLEGLKTNDEGKRLSAEPLIRKFNFLCELPRPDESDLSQAESIANSVRSMVTTASQPISNHVELAKQLRDEHAGLSKELARQNQLTAYVNDLVRAAPAPSARTITQANIELEKNELASIDKEIALRLQIIRTGYDKELAALKAQEEKLKQGLAEAEQRLKNVLDESAKSLKDVALAAVAEAKGREQQRVEARALLERELPSMRAFLTPFTSDGYRQPEVGTVMVMTTESRPVSYSALVRTGTLDDSKAGILHFFRISQGPAPKSTSRSNDRPMGSFPVHTNENDFDNPAIIIQLKTIQKFLRTHGVAMVEAKLLSR